VALTSVSGWRGAHVVAPPILDLFHSDGKKSSGPPGDFFVRK